MLMPNEDEMKHKVRAALTKKEYNVADFYYEKGIWRRIATHRYFEALTLSVITFNALWIAYDTDNNKAATLLEAQPLFQFVEHFFCWYFSFEWYVRFCSFEKKRNCLKDAWFVFDSCLVFMMVVETWVMSFVLLSIGGGGGAGLSNASILRLLRLLRLSRLARMLRSMPELMILIKGMVAASRSVFFTMCLLVILLYLFAIALVQLTADSDVGKAYFPSVPESMFRLLLDGVFLDSLGQISMDLGKPSLGGSPVFVVVFFIFVALAALMVMNMLIGVLCEVVSAVAGTEKEEMLLSALKSKLEDIMKEIDEDQSGRISRDEFLRLVTDPKAAAMLANEVGVDPLGLIEKVNEIFPEPPPMDPEDSHPTMPEQDTIEFHEFMDIVLQYRDSKSATQRDVKELEHMLTNQLTEMKEMMVKEHTITRASSKRPNNGRVESHSPRLKPSVRRGRGRSKTMADPIVSTNESNADLDKKALAHKCITIPDDTLNSNGARMRMYDEAVTQPTPPVDESPVKLEDFNSSSDLSPIPKLDMHVLHASLQQECKNQRQPPSSMSISSLPAAKEVEHALAELQTALKKASSSSLGAVPGMAVHDIADSDLQNLVRRLGPMVDSELALMRIINRGFS